MAATRPTVLITGITGQDGGYLAEQLQGSGAEVHGVVRDGDEALGPLTERVPDAVLHTGDLADPAETAALVGQLRPDRIYNLGGISSVAVSWAQPVVTSQVSGLAVAALLHAAWQLTDAGHPVRFVQASSAELFGDPQHSPQDETTPVAPVNPYGAAKAFGHHLVGVYRRRGMHACSAILYNHESPRRPETFVTRKITAGAARIAGGDREPLALGNLDARRDWGWAPDYVDAMVRMCEHDEPGDYVIATGASHTVREFVAAAFAAAGIDDWEPHVRVDPRFFRPVDAVDLTGDASRAARVLDWHPSVPFTEIVARMVAADTGI